MNEKRTVILATPVLLCGGTEIQTLALARVLRDSGLRVVVCCYYEFDARMVTEFESERAEVHLMRLHRPDSPASYIGMVGLAWKLWRYFRKLDPDIVHVQYLAPGLVPIIAAKLAGVKKIFATIHYPRHLFGAREQRFVRMAANMCSMFFCNSLATERSWFGSAAILGDSGNISERRHCTVYNSVDAKRVRALAGSVNTGAVKRGLKIGRKRIVGVVARLRSEKGHEFLLNAMKLLLLKVPNALLLVVGDGPDAALLKDLAKELRIADHIRWLGAKSHEEALSLLGVMDVVVVPSKFEGFGLSAAEAMAAGIPVVATNVGGLPELVDDGNSGILVPFGDVGRLGEAITKLLSNSSRARKMGKEGSVRAEELFSSSRFEKTMVGFYGK